MMKKIDLDQLIDESISEEVDSIPPPLLSSSEAWERLQQQRNQKTKRISPNMKALIYAASIALIIFTATFSVPQNSSAFSKFTEYFYQIQDSVVQIFIGTGVIDERNSDYPSTGIDQQLQEMLIKNMSLEDARNETSFLIKVPSYVPIGYSLVDVTVFYFEGEQSNNIYLNYSSDESRFTLNIKEIEDQFGFGSTFSEAGSEIEDILINGHPASLITYDTGKKRLVWTTSIYFLSLEGEISREDIIAIAESF